MKSFGRYLLVEEWRASLAAFLFALLGMFIPVSFIAAVIVALVTLQKQYRSGAMVLAFSILPALAMTIAVFLSKSAEPMDIAYQYAIPHLSFLMQCALLFLLACLLRRTMAWHIVLESAALLGMVVVILIHIFIPNVAHIWEHF